jgi:hypothetical protein
MGLERQARLGGQFELIMGGDQLFQSEAPLFLKSSEFPVQKGKAVWIQT